MNPAERLLALYDRVAEAPEAVPRLRRFVLDLAVRGKLLEQNPADETGIGTAEADRGGEGAAGGSREDQSQEITAGQPSQCSVIEPAQRLVFSSPCGSYDLPRLHARTN